MIGSLTTEADPTAVERELAGLGVRRLEADGRGQLGRLARAIRAARSADAADAR